MKTIETTRLGQHSFAVALPGVILAFDPADDPEFKLSAMISANPGVPVVILCTTYDPAVFSQAETTNRTFVCASADIPVGDVPAGAPVSWVSPGDILPDIPGGVSVTAVGSGFVIEKLDSGIKVLFTPRASDCATLTSPFTLAIVPTGAMVQTSERIAY